MRFLDFSTMFGWLGPLILIALAGLATMRIQVVRVWKENYEGEREARLIAERERDAQRELKHQLETELAAAKMRTDLTSVVEALATQAKILDRIVTRLDALDALNAGEARVAAADAARRTA